MYRKTREEIIQELKDRGWIDETELDFYNLPHEEKSNPELFEKFCAVHGGYRGIVFADDEICDNKELVLIAKRYGLYQGLHLLSERLLDDPEMVLIFADCDQYELTKFSKRLRNDPVLMLEVMKIKPNHYSSLTVNAKTDRAIVLEIAERDPRQLKHLLSVRRELREPFQTDKDLAMIVAKKDPESLKMFFSMEILKDPDIQKIAFGIDNPDRCIKQLSKYTWALSLVDSKYWNANTSLIKNALKEDGNLLKILPEAKRNDKKLAIIAVKTSPEVLQYCSKELRDDEEVVAAALQEETEGLLAFASERLRADYKTVLKAVTVDGLNLNYASEDLRDNKDIALQAVREHGAAISYASFRLRNDEEIKRIAYLDMLDMYGDEELEMHDIYSADDMWKFDM